MRQRGAGANSDPVGGRPSAGKRSCWGRAARAWAAWRGGFLAVDQHWAFQLSVPMMADADLGRYGESRWGTTAVPALATSSEELAGTAQVWPALAGSARLNLLWQWHPGTAASPVSFRVHQTTNFEPSLEPSCRLLHCLSTSTRLSKRLAKCSFFQDIIPAPVFRDGIVIGPRKGIGEAVWAENPFSEDTASVWPRLTLGPLWLARGVRDTRIRVRLCYSRKPS
jgi:hypothetical protein